VRSTRAVQLTHDALIVRAEPLCSRVAGEAARHDDPAYRDRHPGPRGGGAVPGVQSVRRKRLVPLERAGSRLVHSPSDGAGAAGGRRRSRRRRSLRVPATRVVSMNGVPTATAARLARGLRMSRVDRCSSHWGRTWYGGWKPPLFTAKPILRQAQDRRLKPRRRTIAPKLKDPERSEWGSGVGGRLCHDVQRHLHRTQAQVF